MKKAPLRAFFFFTVILLSACVSLSVRLDTAQELINHSGFESSILPTQPYALFSAAPADMKSVRELTVVIEGDGYAWVNRNTLSDNPTPRDPVGLRIATSLKDAVYLARPCQYVEAKNCTARVWSVDRFNRDMVIRSYMDALQKLKERTGAESFHLIGFSGGAYIALVLAGKRTDIEDVTSVAGVLDPKAWTDFHDISPLALDFDIKTLILAAQYVPFRHVCSTEDDVVPCSLAQDFIRKSEGFGVHNHSLITYEDEGHGSLWQIALREGWLGVHARGN